MQTKEAAQMQMAVEDIVEGSNCRSRMNPGKFEEFVKNVKKVGILEPALVRRDNNGKVILIAGFRRLAVAKAAGLKEIPVRILDVDEQQAVEIQALENLHREDLTPLDEARAFKHLLDLGQHTVETLAAQVDKSVKYVYRSISLLELPKEAIKALEQNVITTGHAHQLLRTPEKNREALVKYAITPLEWQKRVPTVEELRQRIERTIEKDLASAFFPEDAAYAGEIACTGCPFNTGNQGALFDGASKGKCTNPGCFNKKTSFFYKELQKSGEAKFAGLKFVGAGSAEGYGSAVPRIKGAYVVEKIDEKIKKAMQTKPEQFGYGIVKPSRWSGKKPRITLVCKNAKLAGVTEPRTTSAYREPTPEERERDEFVRRYVERAYYALALDKLVFEKADLLALIKGVWVDEWRRGRLIPLLEGAGVMEIKSENPVFPASALEKKSREALAQFVIMFLLSSESEMLTACFEERKVNVQAVVKKAQAEALKLWVERHSEAA
jgi:ParB/RepB/Spo0J family partition protein